MINRKEYPDKEKEQSQNIQDDEDSRWEFIYKKNQK